MGILAAVRIGPAGEVAHMKDPAPSDKRANGPKPPSKAALRKKLREAEAQVEALRLHLAQLDQGETRRTGDSVAEGRAKALASAIQR